MSVREKGTTSVQSNGSYVTMRNWSRWSTYSAAGYSISEGPETKRWSRKPTEKQKNAQSVRAKTPRVRAQSRSQVPHLPVIGKNVSSKSQPNLWKAGKRQVTITLDPDLSQARPISRSQIASRMSTRSIIKVPTASRAKSVPDLNKQAVMSYFEMDRGLNRSASRSDYVNKGNRKQSASRKRQARKQEAEVDDEPDVTNRRKRVLKRKERPQRRDTSLSSASSMRSNAKQRNGRGVSTNGGNSSLLSVLSMSSLRSSKTGRSGKVSSSASSIGSIASRKPRLQPLRTYAGYQSNHEHSSSRGSLLAPGTPISLILQRSPSLRSVITEYSSYLSLAASSFKSARSSSRSSLSSTGKYYHENTNTINIHDLSSFALKLKNCEKLLIFKAGNE